MSAFNTSPDAILPSSGPRRGAFAAPFDHTPTLLAAGALAYMAETMVHEAAGHGGICLIQGHSITMLAPLFMRCSQVSPLLTAAGPAANVAGAALTYAWLRLAPPRRALSALLVWLLFAFNGLVACGYLCVGAVTGFGDWASLFAWVSLPILWRLPAAIIGVGGYMACLALAVGAFRRFAGEGAILRARLRVRAMIPAAGAALTACAAELAGGRTQPLALALALGSTLVIGYSLASQDTEGPPQAGTADLGPIQASAPLIGVALAAAIAFVAVIGPGFTP